MLYETVFMRRDEPVPAAGYSLQPGAGPVAQRGLGLPAGLRQRADALCAQRRPARPDCQHNQDHDGAACGRTVQPRRSCENPARGHGDRGQLDVSDRRRGADGARPALWPDAPLRQRCRRGAGHLLRRRRGRLCRPNESAGRAAGPAPDRICQPQRPGQRAQPLHGPGSGVAGRLRTGKRPVPRGSLHPHVYQRPAHHDQPQQAALAL